METIFNKAERAINLLPGEKVQVSTASINPLIFIRTDNNNLEMFSASRHPQSGGVKHIKTFDLAQAPFEETVGKNPNNSINTKHLTFKGYLPHSISRNHATITITPDGTIHIQDHSTVGTAIWKTRQVSDEMKSNINTIKNNENDKPPLTPTQLNQFSFQEEDRDTRLNNK